MAFSIEAFSGSTVDTGICIGGTPPLVGVVDDSFRTAADAFVDGPGGIDWATVGTASTSFSPVRETNEFIPSGIMYFSV